MIINKTPTDQFLRGEEGEGGKDEGNRQVGLLALLSLLR